MTVTPATLTPAESAPVRPVRASRLKKLGVRLLACAISTLVTLVALEIGTRLFSEVTPGLTESDPVVGQRYWRNFEDEVYVPEASRKVALRFNDVGFRGPTRPRAKPAGVRRVAILGDSMVASLAVDEEKTLVRQLEQLLNERQSGYRWEVLNFGVNGASPGQELVLYRELVAQFEPDLVLSGFFVGNDLADNCSRLSTNPRIYFDVDEHDQLRQEPFSTRRAAASQFLNRHSRFYVWQRTALNRARHQVYEDLKKLDPGHWVFAREHPDDVARAWKITEVVYRELQREVASRGGKFAVVMIPSGLQIYREPFEDVAARGGAYAASFDASYPDERLGEFCRRAGIPFVSMLEEFRAAAPSGSVAAQDEWLFCNGTGHFNEQGDALAARVLERFVRDQQEPLVAGRATSGPRD